jgi:hypothetical protein
MVGAALESMGAPPAIKPMGHGQASCVELLCNLKICDAAPHPIPGAAQTARGYRNDRQSAA